MSRTQPLPWPNFPVPPDPAVGAVLHEEQGWRWTWAGDRVGCSVIPDGVADVETVVRDRVRAAISTLENAVQNWGSLTAAEKDQALKLAVRGVAKLARMQLRQLDRPGP